MFSIRCEQFVIGREENPPVGPDGKRMSIVRFSNFTPLPGTNPQTGQPILFQVGTCMVEIVLDSAERARLMAMLEADALEQAPEQAPELAGDPQPDGMRAERCLRLQRHPSHVWDGDPEGVWCDGLVWQEGDELPEPTNEYDANGVGPHGESGFDDATLNEIAGEP